MENLHRTHLHHTRQAPHDLNRKLLNRLQAGGETFISNAIIPPSTREIFEAYLSTRREVIAKLETIPLADWWRTGQHEEFGIVSIKQQASYFAAHELTHLPPIERLVKSA